MTRLRSFCVRAIEADSSAVAQPVTAISTWTPGARANKRHRPGDQVHARGDHRGGMDQGRDRRRTFHRVGQPDIKRNLCALGRGGPEQEQRDAKLGRLWQGGQGRSIQDVPVAKVMTGNHGPEPEDGERKAEVADPVDQECLQRRRRGCRPRVPVADQQVAANPHAFPEDIGEQIVIRQYKSRHREDEQTDQGEEPGIARISGHVAHGEDGHQRRDECDHREHHRRQPVDPELDGDLEVADRQPPSRHRGRLGVCRDRARHRKREMPAQCPPRPEHGNSTAAGGHRARR